MKQVIGQGPDVIRAVIIAAAETCDGQVYLWDEDRFMTRAELGEHYKRMEEAGKV